MYDSMQNVHPKTLSCSVIAKGRKDSGDKFKRVSDTINATGEKGAPLHLKAMHNDVGSSAKTYVFPLDEIVYILMQRADGTSNYSILTRSIR
jgi:hypothetical protein